MYHIYPRWEKIVDLQSLAMDKGLLLIINFKKFIHTLMISHPVLMEDMGILLKLAGMYEEGYLVNRWAFGDGQI